MPPIIGRSTEGRDVRINVDRLIETRAIVLSNSGGGKSWALRRLLEQTYGMVQQIMIDVEGEFFTLRERFDYVLAGRPGGADGDCPGEPRSAAMLARKLLELRTSAVIDIYELKPLERIKFVRLFLESMIDAPKNLWHPVLLVIDEAHIFAPEGAKCESTQSVVDMASRGRKRGFCLVPATQRPSMLIKDVSAQCNNKLVGRFSQDIDVERAAKDLGFYKREDKMRFAALNQGEFFAVGPAFCDTVTQIKVGPVTTSHPRAGQRAMTPPPPREAVKKVLASLADLPAEAAKELVTIDELKARVRELETKARTPVHWRPEVEFRVMEQQHAEVVRRYQTAAKRAVEMLANVPQAIEATREFIAPIAGEGDAPKAPEERAERHGRAIEKGTVEVNIAVDHFSETFGKRNGHKREAADTSADARILRALAMLHRPANKRQLGVLAGVNPKKSTWRASMASLKQQGLILIAGDGIELTDAGRASSNHLPPISSDERIAMWSAKFDAGANKLFRELIHATSPLTKEVLGERADIDPKLSTWRAAMAQLRAAGFLIEDSRGFSLDRDLLEG